MISWWRLTRINLNKMCNLIAIFPTFLHSAGEKKGNQKAGVDLGSARYLCFYLVGRGWGVQGGRGARESWRLPAVAVAEGVTPRARRGAGQGRAGVLLATVSSPTPPSPPVTLWNNWNVRSEPGTVSQHTHRQLTVGRGESKRGEEQPTDMLLVLDGRRGGQKV